MSLRSMCWAALVGVALFAGASMALAACTNGTTPDCADAACGYALPPPLGVPDAEAGAAE